MNRNEKYFFYQWLSINKYIILDLNRNRLETKIKYYIYTGHTNNLDRRLKQHRTNPRNRTKKNKQLIWIEVYNTREDARKREYEFKNWSRQYKYNSRKHNDHLKLMIKNNQKLDLFDKIINQETLFSKKISNCNIKHQNNVGILF
jgi:predicted GIY-YIG superfamily endonuclease